VGYDPARRPEDIAAAVRQALGVAGEQGEGLFALAARTFGQSAHVSQIVGRAQQADGVRWVLADAAQLIPLGMPPETDPAQLAIPPMRTVQPALECDGPCVLALDAGHLELSLTADERKEACE
jgi:hypothetical protein